MKGGRAAAVGRGYMASLLPLLLSVHVTASAQDVRTPVPGIACAAPSKTVAAPVVWRGAHDGVRWGEWKVVLGDAKVPVRVIVAQVDPTRMKLSLEIKRDASRLGAWSIDDAPPAARIALNAGQFTDDGPWGWVMHRGREWQAPGAGALAGALVVDSAGRVQVLDAADIPATRSRGFVREAVQSYPTLLNAAGAAPAALCTDNGGIDRGHRDTRLAIGMLVGGQVVVALTRFDGLGTPAGRLPIGPTTPEMAMIMKALGATRALMLDGGLSAQLLIRDGTADAHKWAGLRNVPLALVGIP